VGGGGGGRTAAKKINRRFGFTKPVISVKQREEGDRAGGEASPKKLKESKVEAGAQTVKIKVRGKNQHFGGMTEGKNLRREY